MRRFEFDHSPDIVALDCNCSICVMKQNTHVVVPASRLTILQGEDSITEYRVRPSFHTCYESVKSISSSAALRYAGFMNHMHVLLLELRVCIRAFLPVAPSDCANIAMQFGSRTARHMHCKCAFYNSMSAHCRGRCACCRQCRV